MDWSGFVADDHRVAVTPKYLLFALGGALQAWRAVVRAPHMPTVDEEAALSQLVAALSFAPSVGLSLQETAYRMAYQDALFERAEFSEAERRQIFDATLYLGAAIAEELVQVKAYHGLHFPYELEGILGHDTLVFRHVRSPAAAQAPFAGAGRR